MRRVPATRAALSVLFALLVGEAEALPREGNDAAVEREIVEQALERDVRRGIELEARRDLVDVHGAPLLGQQAHDDVAAERGSGRRRGDHLSPE
jgi:hypothetical protein